MSKVVIKTSDAPSWVREAIRANLGQDIRTITVEAGEEVFLYGSYTDYDKMIVVIECQGKMKRMEGTYYDSILSASKEERSMEKGGSIQLQPDCFILEMHTYSDRITLHVHPQNMAPMLGKKNNVTPRQYAILVTIRSLIPSARKNVWNKTGVSIAELDQLARMGLLTKAHALTMEGKNAMHSMEEGKWGDNHTEAWRKAGKDHVYGDLGYSQEVKKNVTITLDGKKMVIDKFSLSVFSFDRLFNMIDEKISTEPFNVKRISRLNYTTSPAKTPFGVYWVTGLWGLIAEDLGYSKKDIHTAMEDA